MRCLSIGEGRPLILCHGFLSSAEEFGGRFRALAEQRRLIIPDLPGNGESAPLARPHTVDAMAMALESLLTGLGIDEFDVAGLCLGASVACALADRCGDRVDRLVLHTPLLAPSLIRRFYREQVRVLTLPPLWQAVVALSRNRVVSDLYKRYIIVEGEVDQRTAQVNFDNQRRANPAAAREWLRDGLRYEGLAPLLRQEIWKCLAYLKNEGQAILIVDKHLKALVKLADRHTILEKGQVVWSGTSAALLADPTIVQRYLQV